MTSLWNPETTFNRPFMILDTETTGLDDNAEIVELSIINEQGDVIIDTLVKPVNPIPASASAIHEIYDEDVKNAPSFKDIAETLESIFDSVDYCLIYNAGYDTKIISQTYRLHGLPEPDWSCKFPCVMLAYAEYYGQWNDYRKSWKWQTLEKAMEQQKLTVPELRAHSALGDCFRTLAVVRLMEEKMLRGRALDELAKLGQEMGIGYE